MYGNQGTATRQKANKISSFLNAATHQRNATHRGNVQPIHVASVQDAWQRQKENAEKNSKAHLKTEKSFANETMHHSVTLSMLRTETTMQLNLTLNAKHAANAAHREKYDASRKQQLERRRAKRSLSDICTS